MKKKLLTIALTCIGLVGMGQTHVNGKIFRNLEDTHYITIMMDTSYRVIDTMYSVSSGGYECFKSIKAMYKQSGKQYQVTMKYQIDKAGYWQFYSVFVEPYQNKYIIDNGLSQWYLANPQLIH
jgi:hypothetical protein